MQSPWKQTAVFTLEVDTKEITKISPKSGVYNSPKPWSDGKIAFLGHPSKDYSYVAFDVYLSDGKQTKKLTKDLSATPRELFWLNEKELAF